MAITIKHPKNNTVTDFTQADLNAQIALGNFAPGTVLNDITLPSDWNAAHTIIMDAYSIIGNSTNTTAAATVVQYPILGTPSYTTSGFNLLQITANSNTYAQVSIQNTNSGSSSSSDYIATADDGSDSTHYIDMGINNSTGGAAAFTNAHAGYLYVVDNELDIGALGASGVVNVYTTGGTGSPVKAATFDASQNLSVTGNISSVNSTHTGFITIGYSGTASQGALTLTGTPFAGTGTTSTPLLYLNNNATQPTSWNVNGTYIGLDIASGFTGRIIDARNGTGGALLVVSATGGITAADICAFNNGVSSTFYQSSAGYQCTRSPGASQTVFISSGALFTGGTGTTTFPYMFIQPTGTTAATTWSTSGTFYGVNAASGFGGNFIDMRVNGSSSSALIVSSAGNLTTGGGLTVGGSTLLLNGTGKINWNARGFISSPAAGGIQLGDASVAAPVAQTLSVQSVVAGTADTAGQNFTITGSVGTGTGAGGSIIFQTAAASTTGSTQNALASAFSLASDKSAAFNGLIKTYNNVTTAGLGMHAIYGSGRATAQVAANASVATYTVGAADGSFDVAANINVTASVTSNFTVTCTYTDETNTARTLTFTFSQLGGTLLTAITNVTGTGPYSGFTQRIRCKAATAITIATTGTFTSVTYNVEGTITQVA